jgi:hypothetical protein
MLNFLDWFKQFFYNDDNKPSMTRLLCFISIWPSSYLVISKGSTEIFGWYVTAYVLGYVGGKVAEGYQSKGA